MPEPAHIGFYIHRNDPIGKFKALLYLPTNGGWEDTLEPLRNFLIKLPQELAHSPEPNRLAVAVMDYFVKQWGLGSVEMADQLDINIDWFYKISLENSGWFEAFEVKYVEWEGSIRPDGREVIWRVAEYTAELWACVSHPVDWELALNHPLELE